jgi:hypothetical protein
MRTAASRTPEPNSLDRSRYSADITAGSLKVPESRIIADLFLRGIDESSWREALYDQNVLQARNPETAKRLARRACRIV